MVWWWCWLVWVVLVLCWWDCWLMDGWFWWWNLCICGIVGCVFCIVFWDVFLDCLFVIVGDFCFCVCVVIDCVDWCVGRWWCCWFLGCCDFLGVVLCCCLLWVWCFCVVWDWWLFVFCGCEIWFCFLVWRLLGCVCLYGFWFCGWSWRMFCWDDVWLYGLWWFYLFL